MYQFFGWNWVAVFLLFFANPIWMERSAQAVDSRSSILLALKVVSFSKEGKSPVLDEKRLNKLVQDINSIYSICNIRFKLEDFSKIKPETYGLPFHLSSVEKMHEIRRPFDDPRYLVVIATGSWDHKKMGAANAWTAMPGESPAGAVLEEPVSTFAGIVAHEIGHYLSLNHLGDSTNVMNPIIYTNSNQLTASQCQNMRTTAVRFRGSAIRQDDGGNPTASLSAAYSG
jgi:hypothetical protein